MSAKSDQGKDVLVENSDEAVVRELKRRHAKKEASRERLLWFIVLGVVLCIPIVLMIAARLFQVLLMSGF